MKGSTQIFVRRDPTWKRLYAVKGKMILENENAVSFDQVINELLDLYDGKNQSK